LPYLTAVPDSEPPFDDETGPPRSIAPPPSPSAARRTNSAAVPIRAHRAAATRPATMPQRGAAGALAIVPPAVEKARPTTITAAGVPGWSSESDVGVRKTSTNNLPLADRSASMLARALVEVLSGRRPLAQLRVHCAPEIYAGLAARPSTGPLALPHLLTVRVCEPADGVAEVSAAFRRADRVRALAFRLQGVDGRWRITALQLG
ncbi:MAG: Rv3235 family protein, partial [Nakamurella sp.]